jgi:hypothetical protein
MNTKTLVLKNVSTRSQSLMIGIVALGFGVTLPRIFHLAGLGSVMLPMFLPIAFISTVVSLPVILIVAGTTPLLSFALFGAPAWATACIMIVQLSLVGLIAWFLRQKSLNLYAIIPAALLCERIFSLLAAAMFPAIGLMPTSIFASYPGVLFISVFSILFIKIARQVWH